MKVALIRTVYLWFTPFGRNKILYCAVNSIRKNMNNNAILSGLIQRFHLHLPVMKEIEKGTNNKWKCFDLQNKKQRLSKINHSLHNTFIRIIQYLLHETFLMFCRRTHTLTHTRTHTHTNIAKPFIDGISCLLISVLMQVYIDSAPTSYIVLIHCTDECDNKYSTLYRYIHKMLLDVIWDLKCISFCILSGLYLFCNPFVLTTYSSSTESDCWFVFWLSFPNPKMTGKLH